MLVEFARPVLRVAAVLAATLVVLACTAMPPPPTGSPEEQAADQAITARVKAALRSSDIYAEHIEVDTARSVVRLSGWVYSDKASRAATAVSAAVPGVRWVDNQVEIVEPGGAMR